MKHKTPYFTIGLFTIIGSALAVGFILLFGAGRVLEDRIMMETYINESVQGLDVGSAVKLRGVQVGNVEEINFTRNFYELNKPYEERKGYVLVKFELQPKAIGIDNTGQLQIAIRKLTQNGLRVRLASANLTGVAYLELDMSKEVSVENLEHDWNPSLPYIPSTTSSISKLLTAVENVFKKLESIELTEVIAKLESTLGTLEEKIAAVETAAISKDTRSLLADIKTTNSKIQDAIDGLAVETLSDQATETLATLQNKINQIDITSIVASLEKSMNEINEITEVVSSNRKSLSTTVRNFEAISSGIRELSTQLRKSPSALLLGSPPEKVLPRR